MWPTLDGKPPLIIAHRGASGYLPEHTLEAYGLAIELGADVVEPDLVFTKDGILVARHDRYLSTTTNVSDFPQFANRRKIDPDPNGGGKEDWWVEDFTLAELKTLRARQPFPGRSKEFDDQYEIPTFDEILAKVTEGAANADRHVGVYPETKHPGYFEAIGLDFEVPLLTALAGFDAGPVFIQSFEPAILKRLKSKTDAKLIQLVYEATPGAGPNIPLNEIAKYADGVGPSKNIIIAARTKATNFVRDAHKRNLFVHPWTFRDDQRNQNMSLLLTGKIRIGEKANRSDNQALSKDTIVKLGDMEPTAQEQAKAELRIFLRQGVDGTFSDFPDTVFEVRKTLEQESAAHKNAK